MRFEPTQQQALAIGCRGSSFTVAAAAGAGKTAVLVQRVLGRITDTQDPCGVDELLIVTFTNAAAGEMRSRIGEALQERLAREPDSALLRRQLALLGSSRIETVHAFCQKLIRENFSLCGVDPDFRLADETQSDLLKDRALRTVLEEAYAENTPGFAALSENLSDGRSDKKLEETVLSLYDRLRSHPDPGEMLARFPAQCGGAPEDSAWGQYLLTMAEEQAGYACAALARVREEVADIPEVETKYGPVLEGYLAYGERLKADIRAGWDEACARVRAFPKTRMPACKYEGKEFLERVKNAKTLFEKRIADIGTQCLSADRERIQAQNRAMRPMVEALCALTARFSEEYDALKAQRSLLDFSDLEHKALALLQDENGGPSPLAKTLRAQLKEVMVDEYQDTNDIQERIFTLLRQPGDSAFFVGDVKQSIYRFRMADPQIFLRRYDRGEPYTGENGGQRRLALNRNFRSRREVLALCNYVFSRLMTRDFGDVDYDGEQRLYPGRECQGSVPSEVLLLDCTPVQPAPEEAGEDEEETRGVLEARLTARRIARLLREERVPEGEGTRAPRPEDVAILLSSYTNKAPVFRQALLEEGVPCAGSGGAFFGTMEIAVMLSLLRLLQNRRQDIPLVSALRSPLYFFSPDDLARMRLAAPGQDLICGLAALAEGGEALPRRVLDDLDRWCDLGREEPPSRLLRRIYDETGAPGLFAALDGGESRLRNLRRLEDLARDFDSAAGGGLDAFLRWVDRRLAENEDLDAPQEDQSGVRILSIHRSKGLEYPFVLVPDLAKSFNVDDLREPVLFHPGMGLGLRLLDRGEHAEEKTQLQQAIALRLRAEGRSEELRKLYVAMTRAREKLILILSAKTLGSTAEKHLQETGGEPSPAWLAQQSSAMDWLLPVLATHPGAGALRALCSVTPALGSDGAREDLICRVITPDSLRPSARLSREISPEMQENAPETGENAEELALLAARSRLEYAHLAASRLPSKLTPTGLKKLVPEAGEIFGAARSPAVRDHHPEPLRRPGGEALLRGTAMHTLLRWADLSVCGSEAGVLAQADGLVKRGFLTPAQRTLIVPGAVAAFARSPLGQRALRAGRVEREYEFGVLEDASTLIPGGPAGEEILLNGAIDLLLFEEDGLTVVDFKTDRISPENAPAQAETHRLQLELYARAAEKIFVHPVKECWVWFLTAETGVKL